MRVARRPRAFVGVAGPDAGDHLQRMVSNDVLALEIGASCDALLLTAKARVVATLRVLRRGRDDYLLLTEPELGETVRAELSRTRLAARAEIALEEHRSWVVLDVEPPAGALAVRAPDYGVAGYELLDTEPPTGAVELDGEELERLRIRAGTPRFGREIDDRVLPAEAGLVERAVSFQKGCYPGQEPVARLHYRGHPNRALRVLEIEGELPPEPGSPILLDGKTVGRVTSAVPADGAVVALGYVRVEVPEDAALGVGGRTATMVAPARP